MFLGEVRPGARPSEGITIVRWADLSDAEREPLNELFTDHIFPVLTPLAVDPAHPFPYISGLSLNLAVTLVNPKTGNEHFARVKVPPLLPRLVHVELGGEHHDGRPVRTCGSCRSRTSSPPTSTSCSPGWRCTSTTPSGSPATRTSRSRRTTPRTSSPPWRRSSPAAGSARRCASRSRRTSTTTCSTCWSRELAVSDERGLPAARPARPARPQPRRRPRALGPASTRRSCQLHPAGPGPDREQQARRHLRRRPREGRPAAPPLRLVLDVGAGVHRAGRRRPTGARDQADPLPHLR